MSDVAIGEAAGGRREGVIARVAVTLSRHRVYRDAFELALVAVAFLLYFLVRGSVVDRYDEALRHANDVIDLERRMGIFWEPRLQEMVLGRQLLIDLFNFIYFWLDFPLIVVVGLWMYFARRHEYTITRELTGEQMLGWSYRGPFDELPANQGVDHRVISWEEVSATEGTGIVHIAPGCGKEDFALSKLENLAVVAPITSTDRRLRHHIPIGREAGLRTEPSFVMPEYVRAISQQRLTGRPLGTVRAATLDEVERWVTQFTSETRI